MARFCGGRSFDEICQDEDLDPERFAELIEAYQFSDKEPLTDELMKVANTPPSILHRKKVARRVISRMVDYIETFEEEHGRPRGSVMPWGSLGRHD
jgi:type I restriction enzyme R subunit